jgi:hypothetical protein
MEVMMTRYFWFVLPLAGVLFLPAHMASRLPACCAVYPTGNPVVNADQTVIIIWDAATKTEHFIRRASFKSDADEFGFLVPTPAQPELNESGNEAFPFLQTLTEPDRVKKPKPSGDIGCACSSYPMATKMEVRVLEEKMVAGFHAVVLEASSANALASWLRENRYVLSPQVEAWAKPYVNAGWKITALKVAKNKDDNADKNVAVAALRMSFKTDRPLFPYREPDPKYVALKLTATERLLRIYFLAEARYQGALTKDEPWTAKVAWSGPLSAANRQKTLELLKLPETTGPAEWRLTEFEDNWPYRLAPADVYFSRCADQSEVKRPPIVEYVSRSGPPDVATFALAVVVLLPLLLRRFQGGRKG